MMTPPISGSTASACDTFSIYTASKSAFHWDNQSEQSSASTSEQAELCVRAGKANLSCPFVLLMTRLPLVLSG
jgi:hypothetical protein